MHTIMLTFHAQDVGVKMSRLDEGVKYVSSHSILFNGLLVEDTTSPRSILSLTLVMYTPLI